MFPIVVTIFPELNIKANDPTQDGHYSVLRHMNRIIYNQGVPENVDMWSYPTEERLFPPLWPCSAPLQSSEPKGITQGQGCLFPRSPWENVVNALKMSLLGSGIESEKLFLALPFYNVINLAAHRVLFSILAQKEGSLRKEMGFQ